jgi:hypothetical protein
MAGRCTERSRIDVRSSVKMLADPAPAHDHAAKASLFEVPI